MEKPRYFVEKQGGQECSENRHQMDEKTGLASTDFSDRTVVEDVTNEAGQGTDIDNCSERRRGYVYMPSL